MRTKIMILLVGLVAIVMSATWQTTASAEMPFVPALYVQTSTAGGPGLAIQGSGTFLPVYYGGHRWRGHGSYNYYYGQEPYWKHNKYRNCWWENGRKYCSSYRHHRRHHDRYYY